VEAPPPAPVETPAPVQKQRRHSLIFAPEQVSLTTGAGPANYFGTSHTTDSDVGVSWDARVTFGAHSIIALEAGYVGAINNIDVAQSAGGGTRGHMSSEGFDTDFRLQLPMRVQPYIFSGVGYNHLSVSRDNNPSLVLINTGDDQVTIPAGGGLTGYLGRHATLDLRGTYRFIPDNQVSAISNGNLHQWVASARIGYTF
jgi:hypothetical protein